MLSQTVHVILAVAVFVPKYLCKGHMITLRQK